MKRRTLMFLAAQAISLLVAAQTTDKKYDYPVKPGTEAWRQFTTHDQMVKATTLPVKTLLALSTKALLETCLDYPLLADIMAYNSPQQGLEAVAKNFNGLQRLMARKDVAIQVTNTYQRLVSTNTKELTELYDKGRLSFQVSFIELLLSQKEVLANVDKETAGRLKTVIATAHTFKESNKDVFSMVSKSYTLFLSGNFYRHYYSSEFSQKTNEFLNTALLKDAGIVEEITAKTR